VIRQSRPNVHPLLYVEFPGYGFPRLPAKMGNVTLIREEEIEILSTAP
jgi:hypothetical protein